CVRLAGDEPPGTSPGVLIHGLGKSAHRSAPNAGRDGAGDLRQRTGTTGLGRQVLREPSLKFRPTSTHGGPRYSVTSSGPLQIFPVPVGSRVEACQTD